MLFSKAAVLFSILALSVASPIKSKKAGVLTVKSYADFQVSDGVAGNALNEVNANFPVCRTRLWREGGRESPFTDRLYRLTRLTWPT